MTQHISCDLHDYIEVACMYGYQVRLILKDQSTAEGKAKDILTDTETREFLLLETEIGSQQVELIFLDKLQVLTPDARFTEVVFSGSCES
ncbi:Rho-binding antiterminator [Nitrosomonas eutropha]|uniref:Rof transcriptional antiterminator n=2 Tax=Nitrosomonas eutropha TaxID=916 RepID=A0ABX5MBG8_9PROT|nr:Rho-binding antiterminator [Nitrosomonas eutropha]ABI58541.1 transcriptional antiterminator, Rof [Nitrosomonas eutropha C91]PXV82336.1 Rof transcriptional antiterminator [Nitrosomonas eutropha]SEI68238.1 transcriptional antiterminator, Rof [Nitrosomonas eutropha]